MINFDSKTLVAFLKENTDFLLGARMQKIQQPTRQELVFGMRNNGETRKFYVNINPTFFHLCFMSKENESKRYIDIPKQPPMFCMLLRKYLESAKIAKVEQPKNGENLERILEFYFETYNELSEKIYLCLAIELMGKYSNVILYNFDTNVIIGCAHNVGEDKSRERHLMGGLPYVYPSKNARNDYVSLLTFFNDQKITGSLNSAIDNYFSDYQEAEKIKNLKSKLYSNIKTKLKKITTAVEKVSKQSTAIEKADSYRKKGDLIMANLFSNKDFVNAVEVMDYETNSTLKIELDETKTLKENASKFYKLYNKAKTTALKSEEMLEKLKGEKVYLEQILYSIDCAQSMGDLLEIQEEISFGEKEKGKSKTKHSTFQPFNFSTVKIGDFNIYVGKNNKQNDYIVSKLARDEDIWFHTRNCAGSHVVLKVEKGQEPTDEVIFECAKLAKEHSSAKLSSKVGVIYTKRKFIKKPPAAPLGYVIYKNEKEIVV